MTRTPPVACTLTAADLAEQRTRWDRLIARALAEGAKTPLGFCLSFRAEPGVEDELRSLTAAEAECCPWASWTVERTAEAIVLHVRSTAEGAAALHVMFTGGQAAP